MGSHKKDNFTENQFEIAEFAKALSNPARIAILDYLIQTESCICGDIVNEIGLAQATISQHLKALKNIGIIKGNISGTKTCYCINEDKWNEIQEKMSVFFKTFPILKCC
jgi:DNA-binding transcriptional ArsR family regulator